MDHLLSHNAKKKAVRDFIKAYSCSFSVTKNLGANIGSDIPAKLLRAAVGMGGGICSMRATCGSVNAGVAMLGWLHPEGTLSAAELHALCAGYYRSIQDRLFEPDCTLVHNDSQKNAPGKDFEGGVTRKCMSLVKTGLQAIIEARRDVESGEFRRRNESPLQNLEKINAHFAGNSFHCCNSVLDSVAQRTGLDTGGIRNAGRGFCGGIGFNGTVCGAILGGVMCLGIHHAVDLSTSGYLYTLRMTAHKMFRGDRVYENAKVFKPAILYKDGQKIFTSVASRYGSARCRDILSQDLSTGAGIDAYIGGGKIATCRNIAREVADLTVECIKG